VGAQAGEIFLFQELRIADLHCAAEFLGQLGQERIQAINKLADIVEAARTEGAELEDQQRRLPTVRQQGADEHLLENARVQKRGVLAARLRPVPRVRGEHFAGNLFRHFEGESEVLRGVAEQLAPEFRSGELVEGEIAADGGEYLAVFAQALGLEEPLGEASAREVAFAAIDLPEPAFVLPGTAADQDVLRRQLTEPVRQKVAREGIRFFEERTYHDCAAR
jgi:hypothetical protein